MSFVETWTEFWDRTFDCSLPCPRLNDASAPWTDEAAMVANPCNGRDQRGGNNLVVSPAPMAVVHGLVARSCPDPCVAKAAKGHGGLRD